MKRIGLLAATCGILCLALGVGLCQDDMRQVPTTAFKAPQRPAARFAHDDHNAKAKLESCAVCHHGEKDGKPDLEATSEGTPCAECHPLAATAGKTPLQRAFHRQCVGCHEASGKGPLVCGECHVRP